MKPDQDAPATTTAPTPDATPQEKPSRGYRNSHPFEPPTEADIAEAAKRQADELGAMLDAVAPKVRPIFADPNRVRIEAATRLACAMLRHGHSVAELPAKAVALADQIIEAVNSTSPPSP